MPKSSRIIEATATVVAATLLVLIAAIGRPGWAAQPVTVTAADRAQAEQIFKTRCAVCHGQEGRGNGPASVALNPKPQDYHDEAWQKATSDATIEKAIVEGGTAVGKSAAMSPNPDLKDKPGVVVALKDIIRKFGKAGSAS